MLICDLKEEMVICIEKEEGREERVGEGGL